MILCGSVSFGQNTKDIKVRNWQSPAFWHSANRGAETTRSIIIAEGSPSTLHPEAISAPLSFIAMSPCRLVDTRNGSLGGSFRGNDTRSLTVPLAALANPECSSIPTAAAYSLNITVVPTAAVNLGFITAFPNGQPQPNVSTIDWGPSVNGNAIANAAVVPVDAAGTVNFYSSAPANLAVDINGYYSPSGNQSVPSQGQLMRTTLSPTLTTDLTDISNGKIGIQRSDKNPTVHSFGHYGSVVLDAYIAGFYGGANYISQLNGLRLAVDGNEVTLNIDALTSAPTFQIQFDIHILYLP